MSIQKQTGLHKMSIQILVLHASSLLGVLVTDY